MEFGFDFWDDRQSAAADAIARLCVRRWDMAIVGGISNILWKMDDKWNIIQKPVVPHKAVAEVSRIGNV